MPKPTKSHSTALARIYPPFITFFEAEVSKAQEDIEQARKIEPAYLAVREALLATETPTGIRLTRNGNHLLLKSDLEDHHYREYQPLADAITENLRVRRLRDKPDAPIATPDIWTVVWQWYTRQATIKLELNLSYEGNRFATIHRTHRPTIETFHRVEWHDDPKPATQPSPREPIIVSGDMVPF